jgi:hypothetical protein
MPSCKLTAPPPSLHGDKNHYLNHTTKSLHTQTKEFSIHDNEVVPLYNEEQPDKTIHPNNMTTHMGGSKHIVCPMTNKKYSINSGNGKKIINTYNEHVKHGSKQSNCAFTKIKNPTTQRNVSIYGNIGKNIINHYYKLSTTKK